MAEFARAVALVLQAVLQLELKVGGEAISRRHVEAPNISAPMHGLAGHAGDGAERLLVPPHGTEKLRGEFIFCLCVIRKRISAPDAGDLESRLKRLGPKLQMMPRET